MEIPSNHTDAAIISRYQAERGDYIIDMLAEGLRANGIQVHGFVMGPRTMIAITRGLVRGSVDLQKTIIRIATRDEQCDRFDRRLNSPGYELAKITGVLSQLTRVIIAAMDAGNDEERLVKLSEVSRSSENLRIQVVRPA